MCQLAIKLADLVSDLAQLKLRSRGNQMVGMLNSDQPELYPELCSRLERFLESQLSYGELIAMEGKGQIWDQSQLQAKILAGKYFEGYCFRCSSAIFVRIWLEHSPRLDKTWVSLDLDEISSSAWFDSD